MIFLSWRQQVAGRCRRIWNSCGSGPIRRCRRRACSRSAMRGWMGVCRMVASRWGRCTKWLPPGWGRRPGCCRRPLLPDCSPVCRPVVRCCGWRDAPICMRPDCCIWTLGGWYWRAPMTTRGCWGRWRWRCEPAASPRWWGKWGCGGGSVRALPPAGCNWPARRGGSPRSRSAVGRLAARRRTARPAPPAPFGGWPRRRVCKMRLALVRRAQACRAGCWNCAMRAAGGRGNGWWR